jgi:hypothetical protein
MTAAGWCSDSFGVTHAALWRKAEGSPWVPEELPNLDGYDESAARGVCIRMNEIMPDSSFDIYTVGTSWTDGDSAATLWTRDYFGTVTVHNLNDVIVNYDSLDITMRIATGMTRGGIGDSIIYICGWGVEMGVKSLLTSPADPHAFILIEETAEASIRKPHTDAAGLELSAWPNPFSSGVRASYALGSSMHVRLVVYDVEGRPVRVLTDGVQAAGEHKAVWEGIDSLGRPVGSGIYFLRLEAGSRAVTRKAVFLR